MSDWKNGLWISTSALVLLALLMPSAWASHARSHEIYSEIVINGTPEQVWEVLMDFDAYPSWNPFLLAVKGEPQVGGTLVESLNLIGRHNPIRMKATVTERDEHFRFGWKGHVISDKFGMGRHELKILPLDDGHVLFVQHEIFTGFGASLIFGLIRKIAEPQFNAMNRALKARVERTDH